MRVMDLMFVFALVFYTTAIVSNKVVDELRGWMVVVFGVGLGLDSLATFVLCVASASGWTWSTHSVAGLAALVIMALHFVWCLKATRGDLKSQYDFTSYSVFAWLLWLVAFVTGIPASLQFRVAFSAAIVMFAYLAFRLARRIRGALSFIELD